MVAFIKVGAAVEHNTFLSALNHGTARMELDMIGFGPVLKNTRYGRV